MQPMIENAEGATLGELFGQRVRSAVPSPPFVVGTCPHFLPSGMIGFYTLSSAAHYAAVRVSPVPPYLSALTPLRGLVSLGFALGCATRSTFFH